MALSPDGQWVLAIPVDQADHIEVLPVGAGEAQPVPGLGGSDAVLGWGLPRKLLVRSPPLLPTRIQHLDLETGLATLWLDLAPTDRSGVVGMNAFAATPDGAAYAYSYSRALSDLDVAERLE